ncbi:MAG: hypothetical protein PHF97_03510 [Bacteroidales bacterium]|nr:hypothetical protein [Bacteroidales bacterium]MDD4602856.1 hypothetical protein [Bacteroidales bacterium]
MKDLVTLVSGIEYKMNELIERYQVIKSENNRYIKEINELKILQETHKKRIIELEEKINLLKIAKTLETKEGNVEAKIKINDLVREIEKCIGLLNT